MFCRYRCPSLGLRINSSRYPDVYGFPGFRVALAYASLPGMTIQYLFRDTTLIQLHIHDHKLIRSQRLLKHRLQIFLFRHSESFGAVELSQARQVGDK